MSRTFITIDLASVRWLVGWEDFQLPIDEPHKGRGCVRIHVYYFNVALTVVFKLIPTGLVLSKSILGIDGSFEANVYGYLNVARHLNLYMS